MHSPSSDASSSTVGQKNSPHFIEPRGFIAAFTKVRNLPLSSARPIQSMSPLPLIRNPFQYYPTIYAKVFQDVEINTMRTGDADLRFYITNVQDGWRKSAFLTRACCPCTVHLIMQYIEPFSEWSCWRMFIETWPHSELTFRHRASST